MYPPWDRLGIARTFPFQQLNDFKNEWIDLDVPPLGEAWDHVDSPLPTIELFDE
jgi:hypothetical protein